MLIILTYDLLITSAWTMLIILTYDLFITSAWTMSSQLSVHSLVTGKAINQIRYHEGILGHRLGKSFIPLLISGQSNSIPISHFEPFSL